MTLTYAACAFVAVFFLSCLVYQLIHFSDYQQLSPVSSLSIHHPCHQLPISSHTIDCPWTWSATAFVDNYMHLVNLQVESFFKLQEHGIVSTIIAKNLHGVATLDVPTLRHRLNKSSLQNKQLLDQLTHLKEKMELFGYELQSFDALITQEAYT